MIGWKCEDFLRHSNAIENRGYGLRRVALLLTQTWASAADDPDLFLSFYIYADIL